MSYTEIQPVHAGCVAGNVEAAAGCDAARDAKNPTNLQPATGDASAGCAESTSPEADARQVQPPATLREFERALRGLGYTRMQAQAVARSGFGALQASPDAEPESDDDPSIAAALQALAASFKD